VVVGNLVIAFFGSVWRTTSWHHIKVQFFVWLYIYYGLVLLGLRSNYFAVLLLGDLPPSRPISNWQTTRHVNLVHFNVHRRHLWNVFFSILRLVLPSARLNSAFKGHFVVFNDLVLILNELVLQEKILVRLRFLQNQILISLNVFSAVDSFHFFMLFHRRMLCGLYQKVLALLLR
jgi:hypothetical protein